MNELVAKLWGYHDCPQDYEAIASLTAEEYDLVWRYCDSTEDVELPFELKKRIFLIV